MRRWESLKIFHAFQTYNFILNYYFLISIVSQSLQILYFANNSPLNLYNSSLLYWLILCINKGLKKPWHFCCCPNLAEQYVKTKLEIQFSELHSYKITDQLPSTTTSFLIDPSSVLVESVVPNLVSASSFWTPSSICGLATPPPEPHRAESVDQITAGVFCVPCKL